MELIFWTSLGVILYVYAGYPLILAAMALRAKPTGSDENYLPSVSLIIAAYNEEKVLREKARELSGAGLSARSIGDCGCFRWIHGCNQCHCRSLRGPRNYSAQSRSARRQNPRA